MSAYCLHPYDIAVPEFKFIMTWTAEDDIDDTIDNILETFEKTDINDIIKDVRLNYRFINELLIGYTYETKQNSYIQSLITYVDKERNDLNKRTVIKKTFNLYVKLIEYLYYNYFTTFITIDKYTDTIEELILYRGFNYSKYGKILEKTKLLNINEEFITCCFMSTSVYEDTARRFIYNDDETDTENNIMWKINIPKSKYNKFYYSYLSSDKHYFNNPSAIKQKEIEFLMNMNAKLKLIKKYEKYNISYYEWEFVDYEILEEATTNYFKNLNKYANKISNSIKLKKKI